MSDEDPWASDDMQEWMKDVREELIPKLRKSAMTVSLVPSDPAKTDLKFAVELGLSIMFDKPLIVVITPGQKLPDQLVKVATEIVEWDGTVDPNSYMPLIDAINRIGDDG